ncbi:MAG: ATP-binding protein [Planctomycetota bacterium]|jgi:signal transduction histidine kinase/pSer/pThr/pTyr-binding forkhead associated (FHA) protein
MPTLYVLRGSDKGRIFRTPKEPAVLGRLSDHIPLTDDSVSRRHAELRPDNGNWVLTDLASSNGTYLNGVRIDKPCPLKHGDQIKLGGTVLVFSGEDSEGDFGGPKAAQDVVELEQDGGQLDSAILSAIPSGEDSLVLAAPEAAEAVHAWRVMYQLAELLGAGMGIGAFLKCVTDIIFENMVVDCVFVLMRDEESDELQTQAVRQRGKGKDEPARITTSRTIVNHVLQSKEGVLCANAMTDERFADDAKGGSIHRLALRSVICVPILAHDEVQGVIHMDCSMSHHTYTSEHLRLVTAIGRMAGLAIHNARLLESRVVHERLVAVGETVAHLSHYIRNILQGMRSGADVLELGLRRKALDTIQDGWKIIQHNLDRTYQFTTNMLIFSKDRQPAIELGQLNGAVEEGIKLLQRRANEKGVMLLTDLAEDLPPVALDVEGMTQVAANILANACDAAPAQSGRISVRTRYDPASDRVTLTISDNGRGIPQEEIGLIFEAFHSTKGQGGTGLGLAAAYKIVRELGGDIEVHSPPNQGTTFYVRLPVESIKLADSQTTHTPTR